VSRPITLVEVGPRDGLQNEAVALDPATRAVFVQKLEAAGARRLEAVSFVHPRLVPQMAGAEEVMVALPPAPDRRRIGLALNLKGYERAVAAGVDEVNLSIAATDGFGLKNQGMDRAAQGAMVDAVLDAHRAAGGSPDLSVTLSCCWGCPFDGEVSAAQVAEIAGRLDAAGVAEIGLADTIGAGDPWAVTRVVEAVRAAAPRAQLRLHFHDTRNTGLANAYAGVEAGVDVLDASVGGIGGCPFAPGATGNIATEDLVHMLHRAGFETGYDLDALIAAGRWIGEKLGKPVPSALGRAGPFRP
jgi:hydroxymethylglutaryl-CoA lyase